MIPAIAFINITQHNLIIIIDSMTLINILTYTHTIALFFILSSVWSHLRIAMDLTSFEIFVNVDTEVARVYIAVVYLRVTVMIR